MSFPRLKSTLLNFLGEGATVADAASCYLDGRATLVVRRLFHNRGREEAADDVDVGRQDVSLIPLGAQLLQHRAHLSERLVLFNRSQVYNRQIRYGHRFGPRAVEFNDRIVELLTRKTASNRRIGREKTGQSLTQVHQHRRRLLLQIATSTKLQQLSVVSHDDGVRVARPNLQNLLPLHGASRQLEQTWRQLRVEVAVTQLAVAVPTPSVHFPES